MPPIYTIHFVDQRVDFIIELRRLFGTHALYSIGDIQSIPIANTAFVSPANSLGHMDGGIDYIYSTVMFPGCDTQVTDAIQQLGHITPTGRAYLPVGSAITVPVGLTTVLISAPTMFLPRDVSNTRNAYWAFAAVLGAFAKYKQHHPTHPYIYKLVCPLLCTGYGKMPACDAAQQMYDAYCDTLAGLGPSEILHISNPTYFISDHIEIHNTYTYEDIRDDDIRTVVLMQPLPPMLPLLLTPPGHPVSPITTTESCASPRCHSI